MKAAAEVTISGTAELSKALKRLQGVQVKVGIARDSKTDFRNGSGIRNSDLGWIHEKGSPASGIPPRPFLVPAVEQQTDKIKKKLGAAMVAALHGDEKESDKILTRLGQEVASGVKNYMESADFEPLKPATIANRHKSRGTLTRRPEEEPWIMRDGKRVPNPKFGEGVKPLINTGNLRNSIDSYVTKD